MFDKLLLSSGVASQLEGAAQRDSGTVVLTGPAHLGKASAAGIIAAMRSGRQTNDANTIVVGDGIETIGIPEARVLIQSLSLRAHTASKRTVIIDGAELLTNEAQNALLKTLEEPPPDCLIILVTSDLERLLITVRSRAMVIHFGPVTSAALEQLLAAKHPRSAGKVAEIAQLSAGLPGAAMSLVGDQTALGRRAEAAELAAAVRKRDRLSNLALAARLAADTTLADATVEALASSLQQAQDMALGERVTAVRALENYDKRRTANVSLKSCLEGLFLEIRNA